MNLRAITRNILLRGDSLGGVAVLVCLIAAGVSCPAMAAPKVQLNAYPSTTAVVAGRPFDIALKFTVADEWHIYWKNPGDAGLPPMAEWTLPDGFHVQPFQFPLPQRHLDPGRISTNILEGEVILIATVTTPNNLGSNDTVDIRGDIFWLVCKDLCIREEQSIALKLPVAKSPSDAKPANQDVFKAARWNMPVPADKAKLVKIKPTLGKGRVAPDAKFDIHLEVDIKKRFHIQSNRPLTPGYIATEVFMASTDNVSFSQAIYPKASVRTIPDFGKVAEFGGKITIRIPAQADEELSGEARTIEGLLIYQGCDDKTGVCYPPEGVEWSFTVPVTLAAATTGQSDASLAAAETDVPAPTAPAAAVSEPKPKETAAQNAAPINESLSETDWLEQFLTRFGLPGLFVGCFLYGLMINATPCVLPLLSIKIIGFVQQAHESRRRTLALGVSFGVGVILFFIALGFLAATGKNILQYPAAVIALSAVVTALALSMLGVYTLQVPTAATKLEASIQKEGIFASFGKGALAPVLGFACTGPLLAGVFAWATQQPPRTAVFAFTFAGLGMASPYMLLGANPNWLSFLPKPGNWMITFERIMGFLLLGMVVYLLNPLVVQIGAEGLQWTLAFFVVIAMGCWLLGQITMSMSAATRWRYRTAATALVVFAGLVVYGWAYPLDQAMAKQRSLQFASAANTGNDWSNGIPWRRWSPEEVEQTVRAGKTVFVDFTAAYCTNCKANKKVAIERNETRKRMIDLGVVPYRGDFTTGDPEIAATLLKFGRTGVPLNLIYSAGKPDDPIVLSTLFTLSHLLQKLDQAGPSANTLASTQTP